VPITTQSKKSKLPTHVAISKSCGLDSDSIALAEQLRTIDKERLGEYVGEVASDELALVEKAMAVSLGLKPSKPTIWDVTLCSRCKSNFELAGRLLVKRGFSETHETCDYCSVGKGLTYGVF
jgi:mRNA interferase MazF